MRPTRIQRQRTKGWRMPEGAVYVGRPTRWGNPYTMAFSRSVLPFLSGDETEQEYEAAVREFTVIAYREMVAPTLSSDLWRYLEPLRGRDLVCWCRLDQPCHADVLLELANKSSSAFRERRLGLDAIEETP